MSVLDDKVVQFQELMAFYPARCDRCGRAAVVRGYHYAEVEGHGFSYGWCGSSLDLCGGRLRLVTGDDGALVLAVHRVGGTEALDDLPRVVPP